MIVIHYGNKATDVLNSNDGKIMWHIVEKDVIPLAQRSAFVTQLNKFFRENNTKKLENISHLSFDKWSDVFINNFENTLTEEYPSILAIKRLFLKASAFYISLSGSGSAVFGLFHSPVDLVFPSSYFVWKGQLH